MSLSNFINCFKLRFSIFSMVVFFIFMGAIPVFCEESRPEYANLTEEVTSREDFSPEYDESGNPMCGNCHFGEKRPAIDYTGDPECLQCHNADYSQRFLDIDERYKVSVKDATKSYIQYASTKTSAPTDKSVSSGSSIGKLKVPPGMVLITAGEFLMGSDEWWPKSSPQHKRSLPDFFMDKYEVTNEEYQKFIVAKKHHTPDHWVANHGKIPPKKKKHPVTYVDWFDASKYCEWRGKRLPSEGEWEKAARGTTGLTFPWGNEFDKNKANTPQYGNKDTMPVGSFKNGASPYGVHDLAGNVFEWTTSWYKAYPGNTHKDPNEGERYRVVRGGSYYDCTYYKCGISSPTFNRIFFNPFTRNNNFGFRCVKGAE